MINPDKILSNLPDIHGIEVNRMSFDDLRNLIIAMQDAEKSIDDAGTEVEDPKIELPEEEVQAAEEETEEIEEAISETDENGQPKTKQQLADERWELRRAKAAERKERTIERINNAANKTNEIIDKVSVYVSIVSSMLNVSMYIDELRKKYDELCDRFRKEAEPYLKELEFRIEIIKLKIRKLTLRIKRKLKYYEARLWYFISQSKCCGAAIAVQSALVAAAQAVGMVLSIIDQIIAQLPDLFAISGEGMAFFMTPKSMVSGELSVHIPIMNLHRSLGNFLNEAVQLALQELLIHTKLINLSEKGTQISSNIALAESKGEVLGKAGMNITVTVPSTEFLIRKAVDAIVSMIPDPQPLPKLERLNMATNPGYLLFLLSGWCRSGQVAFGAPGYMPGVPATPVEYKEM